MEWNKQAGNFQTAAIITAENLTLPQLQQSKHSKQLFTYYKRKLILPLTSSSDATSNNN